MKQLKQLLLLMLLFLAACGTSTETTTPATEPETDAVPTTAPAEEASSSEEAAMTVLDISIFDPAALVQDPAVVDCTLTNGTETECAQIVVKYLPDTLQIGPFCPDNVFDDVGGIWEWDGDNPGTYRLNEAFFTMLTEQGFNFYDAGGNAYISDPAGGLIADVNNCLEASADDTVEMTAVIPLQPVMADSPTQLGTVAQVGLAIDGVPIFSDAPSVLDRGHLPALDTCGGHIDPGGWYHWHATSTDIESSFEHEGVDADCHLEQDPSALFAYAFDGHPIYGSSEPDGSIPADLDACGGHIGPTAEFPDDIYHYHASLEFPNLPTCLVGLSANNAFATTASGGIGAQGGGRGEEGQQGGLPDFAAAAEILGISEDTLREALGDPPPDFEAAATTLGISTQELQEALGVGGAP